MIKRKRSKMAIGRPPADPTMSLLIDPGHGGHDPGCRWVDEETGEVFFEKDIVLDVAQKMIPHLPTDRVYVHMTRTTDEHIALRERVVTNFAYDLYLSIHCNAVDPQHYDVEEVCGTEVIVYSLKDELLVRLARHFLTPVAKSLGIEPNDPNPIRENRNLRTLKLTEYQRDRVGRSPSVLRPAMYSDTVGAKDKGVPGLIVELGYLTNSRDRAALTNERKRKAVAKALAIAVDMLAPKPMEP